MNREPRISDIASEAEPPHRPPWLLPAVIGVGGFALGLLVATTIGSTGPSEATPTLPPPTVPSITATSRQAPTTGPPLGELVPGFEGTLYVIDPSSSFQQSAGPPLLLWPATMPEPMISDVAAMGLQIDSSGQRVAYSSYSGQMALLRVDEEGLDPTSSRGYFTAGVGVQSFAWHATSPGLLAWVESEGNDRWTLKTADATHPEALFVRNIIKDFDEPILLRYWDDEVFVVDVVRGQLNDDEPFSVAPLTRVLDPSGELLAEANFLFLDRLPSGELVIAEQSNDTAPFTVSLTDVGLETRKQPPGLLDGQVAFLFLPSPDGTRVAASLSDESMVGSPGQWELKVFSSDDFLNPSTWEMSSGFPIWSPDSRWLLHQSSPDSLEFIDVATNETYSVDWQEGWSLTAVGG